MTTTSKDTGFSAEEKAAMKERAKELKAQAKGAAGEKDILDKIADMPEEDRELAEALHALVKDVVPDVGMRTWYGMPAYCRADKVVCFFQGAAKMGTRYNTVGFSDAASLDDGSLWPTSFAIASWNATNEKKIRALVKKAFDNS